MAAFPSMESALDAFGQPALVAQADLMDPVDAQLIWIGSVTEDSPGGVAMTRRSLRMVAAFRRRGDRLDGAPLLLPDRTVVQAAPPEGGAMRTWRTDGPSVAGFDEIRVVLVAADEDCG